MSSRTLYDRDFLSLIASNFFFSLYTTVFLFIPPFLYRLGCREGEIGVLMAAGILASVALKPVNGFFVDRGRRVAFLAAGTLLASATTLPWLLVASRGPHLAAIRLLQGLAYSLFVTASYAYIAACAPPERRGEALGIFGLSYFVPAALGGWLGERIIEGWGFPGLFVAAAAVAAAGALPLVLLREPPARSELSLSGIRELLTRHHLVPNTAGFVFGAAYGTLFTFLPVFLEVRRTSSIGLFMTVYALSVIATRTAGRRAVDRLPRGPVSLLALLLMGAGIAAVPLVSGAALLSLVGIVSGAGHGLVFPALSSLVLDRTDGDRGGMALALFTSSYDMGAVVGAALFGLVAERVGLPAMFPAAGLFIAAGAVLFALTDPAFRETPSPPGPPA